MVEKVGILCVDDEPLNLMLFSKIFEKHYQIHTAASGVEGLAVLKEADDIRFVISDMKMPGMTGLEFVEKAKASYPNVVYTILSGFEITKEVSEALKSGLIANYFTKPFEKDYIKEVIDSSLGLK